MDLAVELLAPPLPPSFDGGESPTGGGPMTRSGGILPLAPPEGSVAGGSALGNVLCNVCRQHGHYSHDCPNHRTTPDGASHLHFRTGEPVRAPYAAPVNGYGYSSHGAPIGHGMGGSAAGFGGRGFGFRGGYRGGRGGAGSVVSVAPTATPSALGGGPLPFPVADAPPAQMLSMSRAEEPLARLRASLGTIEEIVGHKFRDRSNLLTAFVSRSYASEFRLDRFHNERLEFFGDAVLGLVVTEYLYVNLPNRSEGELSTLRSRLVDKKACDSYTLKLGLERFVEVGRADKRNPTALPAVRADLFEALLGALYLDAGLDAAKKFILEKVGLEVHKLLAAPESNWKQVLQIYCQSNYRKCPVYKLLEASGPAHARTFTVSVLFDSVTLGTGEASTRKGAETAAALDAVRRYGIAKTEASAEDEGMDRTDLGSLPDVSRNFAAL